MPEKTPKQLTQQQLNKLQSKPRTKQNLSKPIPKKK